MLLSPSFCLPIGPGLGTEPPDRPTEIFSVILFVAISPASYGLGLLHVLGISLDFVDWMVGLALVPLGWGAVAYFIGQSFRITLQAFRHR